MLIVMFVVCVEVYQNDQAVGRMGVTYFINLFNVLCLFQLFREVRIMKILNHPNIGTLFLSHNFQLWRNFSFFTVKIAVV